MSRENNQRSVSLCVLHRGIKNRHLLTLAIGEIFRHASFGSGDHQILYPHVGECSPRHHQIVSAPAAVAIEISGLNPARHQILSGWRSFFDRSRRGNVVRCYGVPENPKGARAADFGDMAGLHREILEKRRLMNVIALFVPLVNVAGARRNLIPLRVLVRKIAIEFAKSLWHQG